MADPTLDDRIRRIEAALGAPSHPSSDDEHDQAEQGLSEVQMADIAKGFQAWRDAQPNPLERT